MDEYGTKRWVSKTSRKRYAHDTKEGAYLSFIARRTRANGIMQAVINSNVLFIARAKAEIGNLP